MTSPTRGTATPAKVQAALVTVQLLFASLGVVAKLMLRTLPPAGLIAIRTSLAAALFATVWWAQGRERVAPRDLARIALYALFGVTANQLLFVEGLQRTTATNAVVLGASIPVFTVAVALLLGRERATSLKLAGLGVALSGALALTGVAHFRAGDGRVLIGNLLVLANSACYSIFLVLSRQVLGRYRAMTVVAWLFVFGALGVAPIGARAFLSAAPGLGAPTWVAIAYIVIFPTVGAYFLNAWALARVESSTVAIYIYLQPLLGALLAAAVLGERPGIDTVVGGAAIFAGIWMVVAGGRRRGRAMS